MNRLAVVIPTYRESSLEQTVNALHEQDVLPDDIVVVNNDPDDELSVTPWTDRLAGNVHILNEPCKGTGIAANSGFRFAIDALGADVVARTDADGYPHVDWVAKIKHHFATNLNKQLLAGCNVPLRDNDFRTYDSWAWPPFWWGIKRLGALSTSDPTYLRVAPGSNMAIRSNAYDAVGGFPATAIDSVDEDVILSKRVHRRYGFGAMGYDRSLQVSTSLRRIRQVGYLGLSIYYAMPDAELRAQLSGGDVDIR